MNRKAVLKILIRTSDGKQQEFTMSGTVENPDIALGSIMYVIEKAINDFSGVRAHADIVEDK